MLEMINIIAGVLTKFQAELNFYIKCHYEWLVKQVDIQANLANIKASTEVALKHLDVSIKQMELSNQIYLRLVGTAEHLVWWIGVVCGLFIIVKVFTAPIRITKEPGDDSK